MQTDVESGGPPAMSRAVPVGDGVIALPATLPIPDAGTLAVNAFLLEGREPVLVDTGLAALGDAFVDTLRACIDPAALRWIWISHLDADHSGNLAAVLRAAPDARVLTSFLGRGKMMLQGLPIERVQLIEAGQTLRTPDRCLQALRPPYYDAPETLGFFDAVSSSLFVADAYGALLPRQPTTADTLDHAVLRGGIAAWSALDAPWLAGFRHEALHQALDALDALQPRRVLSAHLPPAHRLDTLSAIVLDLHAGNDGGDAGLRAAA